MTDTKLVSCGPGILYSNGGYYDPAYPIERLIADSDVVSNSINFETMLFYGSTSSRSQENCIATTEEKNDLSIYYKHVADNFNVCAPSILVNIKDALIWNNMVFMLSGDDVYPIYETYRAPDRNEQGPNLLERLPRPEDRVKLPDDKARIFIGSAGSFNYGHWLVDDFAKLKAVDYIKKTHKNLSIVMSSYHDLIDRVRSEGSMLFLDTENGDSVDFIDRNICYHISNLYFPTPISFHPVLKNNYALEFTRNFLISASESMEVDIPIRKTLFANRSDKWTRHITNIEDFRAALAPLDWYESYFDDTNLLEQVRYFNNADLVIGIMGASMTNQLFAKPGSKFVYIAPGGWQEPFYWDLSDQLGMQFNIYYGRPDMESSPAAYQRSFSVDANDVFDMLS